MRTTMKRRLLTVATAGLLTVGGIATSLVIAQPAAAVTICEQFGSTTAGDYRIMNNRWGTSATQCINTTANGFTITQQDGIGNFQGAPTAYPAIYLGCHYSSCSPSTALPRQISTIGTANGSISLTYPSGGSWNAAYDIWINADNNTTGVQDTEIMIWLNRNTAAGNIQPIGSTVGTANIAGRSWQVWTGNNGQNNVVSYLFQGSPLTSFSFDVMGFINDTLGRGSQLGTRSWWLTSVQAGFEPWVGGVGLTVNSFSQTVSGTTGGVPGTPGTPVASGVTSSSITLNWAASTGTVNNYQIERCQGVGCTGFAQIGTSTSTTFVNNTGLAASTTYRYRVRAVNSVGNSPFSGIVDVMTTGTGTQPPGTPGTLSVQGTTASTVSLTWGASSGTVANYLIERCTGVGCTSFTQVATSTTTSFTDGGRAASTTYRYRVRATNSAGNSGYSNIADGTTGPGGGGGGCSATLTLQNGWNNGYVMQPNGVTNTGTSTINGWTVTFTLPAGHSITGFWNASVTVSGQTVTARGISGQNATLGGGQSTTWGLQATRPDGNTQVPQGPTCTSP
ncbi:MAG TPA: fibronectin type III domain-containing protein [Candidatus Limnocylindrales bacterium]|nr:fibronectin type III domain-containing protein [Candidatus Limnocylindrales bacterium]